jgi:hypothetical protein
MIGISYPTSHARILSTSSEYKLLVCEDDAELAFQDADYPLEIVAKVRGLSCEPQVDSFFCRLVNPFQPISSLAIITVYLTFVFLKYSSQPQSLHSETLSYLLFVPLSLFTIKPNLLPLAQTPTLTLKNSNSAL